MLSSQDNAGEDCSVFVAPDGTVQEVMCCDYGFRSGFGRLYQGGDGEIPKNAFALVRARLGSAAHGCCMLSAAPSSPLLSPCAVRCSNRYCALQHVAPLIILSAWARPSLHAIVDRVAEGSSSCGRRRVQQELVVLCAPGIRGGRTSARSSSSCGAASASMSTARSGQPRRPRPSSRGCAGTPSSPLLAWNLAV